MTEAQLKKEYFKWMNGLVCDGHHYSQDISYNKLLKYLHSREFTFLLDMDANRVQDGIDLRYRFGYECGYEDSMIAEYIDTTPCSILEMMVALSLRCEETIMDDPDLGNRIGQWFWNMIVSLEIGHMTDSYFDEEQADDIIYRFLYREYESDGRGGLYTLEHPKRDLRTVEIWCQMMWYLSENMLEG